MNNLDSTATAGENALIGNRLPRFKTVSLVDGQPLAWIALVLGIQLFSYGPLLWLFFEQQWQKPQYQYFPFVIAAFCWLLWTRWGDATSSTFRSLPRAWLVPLLEIASALLLAFGLSIRSPWFAMVSLIVLIAAWFVRISRTRDVVNLWGIWILLWLLVPPPRNLDQTLITQLQFVSSQLSSFVLDSLSIDHLMDGNTLALGSKQLFVDDACSGIVSMLSIIACAVIFCVVKNRTPFHLVLLSLTSIVWATLINVIRISLIAIVLEWWGIDWSEGTPHELLSLVLFLITFLMLLCTDQLLLACLSPIRSAWNISHGNSIRFGRSLVSIWDWLSTSGELQSQGDEPRNSVHKQERVAAYPFHQKRSWFLTAVFAPLAALQGTLLVYAFERSAERLPSVQMALQYSAQSLPDQLCGLHRTDFQSQQRSTTNIQGKYSRTYIYSADGGASYMLSLDFPFPGFWHELTACYLATGWHLTERNVVSPDATSKASAPWRFVDARFTKSSGERGSLCFAEFDQFGEPYDPDAAGLKDQDAFWSSRNLYLKDSQVFQVQVWSDGPTEWTPEQERIAHQLLLEARQRFRSEITDASPTPSHVRSGSDLGDITGDPLPPSSDKREHEATGPERAAPNKNE